MNVQIVEIKDIMLPLIFILLSLFAGIAINKMIFSKLQSKALQNPGIVYPLFIRSLKGMPIVWSAVLGIYGVIHYIPMQDSFLRMLENVLLSLILFSSTIVAARMIVGLVNVYAQRAEGVFPSTSIFVNLAEFITYVIGFLIILQSMGISITPILTALGVGGLAVALALQDTLSNLFSGLHILLSRQFKIGDYIKLSTGEEGYIVDITWRNTTIKAITNNMIVVPNAKIASAIITNYYMPERELAVIIPVGVSYDSDLEHVEKVTIEVARDVMKDVTGGVTGFEPMLWFTGFEDSSINFNVMLRAKEFIEQYSLRHEFIKRLHVRYRQENIEIPFPIRTVYMKKSV